MRTRRYRKRYCLDCLSPTSPRALRCVPCNERRQREGRMAAAFPSRAGACHVEPFGMIVLPERVTVTYVRKGSGGVSLITCDVGLCRGKIAYPSLNEARRAGEHAARRRERQHKAGERLQPFRCRDCGQFHIGRNPKHRRADRKARL